MGLFCRYFEREIVDPCYLETKNVAVHFYGLPLDLCGKRGIWYCGTFCQMRRNSAKRATFSREKHRNPWESVKVRRTRWSKYSTRYHLANQYRRGTFVAFFLTHATHSILQFVKLLKLKISISTTLLSHTG